MTETDDYIKGVRFQDDENPDVIYCGPCNPSAAIGQSITYDDIVNATVNFLVDNEGFSPESFRIVEQEDRSDRSLLVKVKFVEDGITMAKIRGLLE
jgi:hypothetical protein